MCYLDIIQGVLTLKFYSAPEPNLPLQQLQLVPTLLSPQHPPPLTSVNFTSLFIILRSLSQINENIWQTDPTQVIQYYCFNVSLYFSSNTILTSLYISPSIQYLHCCVWDIYPSYQRIWVERGLEEGGRGCGRLVLSAGEIIREA